MQPNYQKVKPALYPLERCHPTDKRKLRKGKPQNLSINPIIDIKSCNFAKNLLFTCSQNSSYMKQFFFLFAIVVSVLFTACSSGGGGNSQELVSKITEAESAFTKNSSSAALDPSLAKTAIEAYEAYAKALPTDDKTPMYLFKSAEMHRSLRQYNEAIAIYDRIQKDYNSFEKAPHSLFLTGFTYENDLKDLEKAKTAYESFLKTYPEHELADDVQFSLSNLGKSPDDIIKAFTEKNPSANAKADTAKTVNEKNANTKGNSAKK